ncbi:P27 family phage terminase small subunit [Streptomyces laurentii]|uniref:p27 family phage terminase small subunit n=1 Tax=Streptomyces laurentii TaxID=39478 RepID=A0A161JGX1_STRLU|nr:P27 family phage terminase small subunit [Streptomyces laurentii]
MADPTRRKPPLQVVREGNPGKRPVAEGVSVPPAELVEPDWMDTFADVSGDQGAVNARCREVASREWQRVVPVLEFTAGLGSVDTATLTDYCICVARIDQCEREISVNGILMQGERGWQKNGATTIVGQYRTQLARYIGELGLSPSARGRLTPPDNMGDDDGDVFD